MDFASHSLPLQAAFRAQPSALSTSAFVATGAVTSPLVKRVGGDSAVEGEDDDPCFPTQAWVRSQTCPARCVQADEDLMFAFDEDFDEEAEKAGPAAAAEGDDDIGVAFESQRHRNCCLLGLFFLDE